MAADIDCSSCMDGTNDPDLALDEKIQVRSGRMALAQPDILEDPAHEERKLRTTKIFFARERL